MKIVIIDDDNLVTMALKTIIESDSDFCVVATGKNGKEAILLYQQYLPDILLMDIRMEEMTGLDSAKEILKQYPNAKILFLTTFLQDEYIFKAIGLGAKGYLLKQDFSSIIPSLKAVFSNQIVFGNEIIQKIPNLWNSTSTINYQNLGITQKEFEIMQAIADGYSNKEIADKLFFSEGTIRNYISSILEKLNLRDRTQIAIFYYKNKSSNK